MNVDRYDKLKPNQPQEGQLTALDQAAELTHSEPEDSSLLPDAAALGEGQGQGQPQQQQQLSGKLAKAFELISPEDLFFQAGTYLSSLSHSIHDRTPAKQDYEVFSPPPDYEVFSGPDSE
jgi:hypothetical protein